MSASSATGTRVPGSEMKIIFDHCGSGLVADQFAEAAKAAGNRVDLLPLGDEVGHTFVLPFYKSPEPLVVANLPTTDRILESLGWITGPPTVVVSTPPAREIKPKRYDRSLGQRTVPTIAPSTR